MDIDLTIDNGTLVDNIVEAAESLDRPRAKVYAEELIRRARASQDLFPVDDAKSVLEALRLQRYLDLVDRVADTLIQTGITDTRVRRDYVQALIDQGSRTAAIHMLQGLLADAAEDDPMKNEARGLLGRAYKQLYIDAGEPELERNRVLLRKSLEHYRSACDAKVEKPMWHAINIVALLKRATRDQVDIGGTGWPSADRLAGTLLKEVENFDGTPGVWEMATAMEACVALGRVKEAARWAKKLADSGAKAFELGSALRQLEEVWQLDTTKEMGAAVLPILRNGLLKEDRTRGFFTVSPKEVRADLERVLGTDSFQSLTWYRNGLERARAVGRIGRDESRGDGTGFLVRGGDLHDSLGDELLLLTNAHVISDVAAHNPAVPDFREAGVIFEAATGDAVGKTYKIREILGRSGPGEYDFALLRLDPSFTADPPVKPYEVAAGLPTNDEKQRVYIIGHPGGGVLSFSMQDNLLLDYDDRLLHYRAPTEGGSSGSPVFNGQWKLIGLHHAGYTSVNRLNNKGGTYAANEGISIFAIREELKKQLG